MLMDDARNSSGQWSATVTKNGLPHASYALDQANLTQGLQGIHDSARSTESYKYSSDDSPRSGTFSMRDGHDTHNYQVNLSTPEGKNVDSSRILSGQDDEHDIEYARASRLERGGPGGSPSLKAWEKSKAAKAAAAAEKESAPESFGGESTTPTPREERQEGASSRNDNFTAGNFNPNNPA